MGKYFRNGRLISADTFSVKGYRTLTGAGEEDLWAGTETVRPAPSGIQLRFVSTSAEDDNVKAEKQTVTIGGTMDPVLSKIVDATVAGTMQPVLSKIVEATLVGTMQPATADEWTCTLGGNVNVGDKARLTLNGVDFDTEVTPAVNTLATLCAEIATSGNSGTWDTWKIVPGGVLDAGDIITLTIPGSGASPYTYTVQGGDDAAAVATGLKNAVLADGGATYTASSFGANLKITKLARGAGAAVTCTWTTDPGLDATVTVTHEVTGVAGQAAWTCTDNGVSAVICTHAALGVTADTVASSYVTDPLADSTFTAVHGTTGEDADIAAVTLQGVEFRHTIGGADTLDTTATALASLIDADAAYTAAAVGAVITIEGLPNTAYTTADTSANNRVGGVDLAASFNVTQTEAAADVAGIRLTGAGAEDFNHTIVAGNTTDIVATALAALIDASANYTASAVGSVITIEGNPNVAYTAADISVNNQAGGVALSVTPATIQTQAPADIIRVTDGTLTWAHTVTGNANAEATALAALIDAEAAYVATANNNVVTVTAAVEGVGFTLTNSSTDNQNQDLSVVIATLLANGGGNGIRTLRLDYLDTNGTKQAETVAMNGVTASLTTATDVTGILAVTALTVGSTGSAVGTITVKNVAASVTYDQLAIGQVATDPGCYKVPVRQQAWVSSLHGSATAASELRIRSNCNPVTGAVVDGAFFEWAQTHVGASPGAYDPSYPIGPFPAGSLVKVTGKGAGNPTFAATIEGYLEPV